MAAAVAVRIKTHTHTHTHAHTRTHTHAHTHTHTHTRTHTHTQITSQNLLPAAAPANQLVRSCLDLNSLCNEKVFSSSTHFVCVCVYFCLCLCPGFLLFPPFLIIPPLQQSRYSFQMATRLGFNAPNVVHLNCTSFGEMQEWIFAISHAAFDSPPRFPAVCFFVLLRVKITDKKKS